MAARTKRAAQRPRLGAGLAVFCGLLLCAVSASAAPEAAPSAKAGDAPAPSGKPADKASEKPADKASKPADKASEKPADKASKPADKASEKPADKSEKAADKAEESASKSEKPADKPGASADGPGPGAGSGQRHVEPSDTPRDAEKKPEAAPETKAKSHKQGPAPRKPASTVPEGAQRSAASVAARRSIAEGPIDGDAENGLDDDEIKALVDADRVLFPRPLVGATPGWSWGLPQKAAPRSGGSGLPPQGGLSPQKPDDSSKRAAWLGKLVMPNFDVRLDPRVVKYLDFYKSNPRGQAIAKVWAKKSGRFTPALQAELSKAGMPTDLVWLSLIESGHNPAIYSSAGAAGLWQFIPDSGRMYGLTVDRWVDERLDPQRSTQAAIKYLADLHRRFGNWELAMAAYNMGHGGLSRAIRKYNSNDFWELSRYEAGIPWETSLYVPKIAAIAIVMNNKRAFGLDGITPDPAESFDTVTVPAGVSLDQVASAAGLPKERIASLNPHYLAGRVPPPAAAGEKAPSSWAVRVPRGSGVSARQALGKIARIDAQYEPYLVRFGDTVTEIARERGVSEQSVRKINDIGRAETLVGGDVLLVPKTKGKPSEPAEQEVAVVPPRPFSYKSRSRVFYQALPGDSLEAVAAAFEVSRSELMAWNGLDTSARLLSGMMLQVFVKPSTDLGRIRTVEKPLVLVAGSEDFFEHFEGKAGRKRLRVKVMAGDSLWKIGKRYGMSVGMMERINRISRNKDLQVGESLIVYSRATAGSVPAPENQDEKPEPLPAVKAPAPEALPGASRID